MSEVKENIEKRPRILMLSYHFPPLDVVASARALSFAQHLPEFGMDVTVLTINWQGEEDLIESREYELVALGCKKKPKWPAWTWWPVVSKIVAYQQYQKGRFEPHVVWHEKVILDKARELLLTENFDLILGMYSPHFHLSQCYELHREYGVPYVVDFRDMWANRVMANDYRPNSNERSKDLFFEKYWSLWMSKAAGFTTVAESFRSRIEEITGVKGRAIFNGFEDDYPERQGFEKFTISHIGNLLPWKDIDPFIEGLALFKEGGNDFNVRFVGANDALIHRIKSAAQAKGILDHFQFIDRVSSVEARQEMVNADVLYYPPIEGFSGMYSAKIFEYLGSSTPVLVTPNDNDVIEGLMEETEAGVVCETALDVAEFLQLGLRKRSGQRGGRDEKVEKYSRREQARRFASEYLTVGWQEELKIAK